MSWFICCVAGLLRRVPPFVAVICWFKRMKILCQFVGPCFISFGEQFPSFLIAVQKIHLIVFSSREEATFLLLRCKCQFHIFMLFWAMSACLQENTGVYLHRWYLKFVREMYIYFTITILQGIIYGTAQRFWMRHVFRKLYCKVFLWVAYLRTHETIGLLT